MAILYQDKSELQEALDGNNPVMNSAAGFTSVYANSVRGVRSLPHCSMESLYEEYIARLPKDVHPCSQRTFARVREVWSKVLRVRKTSQHARCDTCSKYDAVRDAAKGRGDSKQAEAAIFGKSRHISEMLADRCYEMRMNTLSELSNGPSGFGQ